MEWPNVVQLRRTGDNRPVEVRTKPEGPDEGHEVPAHISERINVEPTAGETARFQGEPPVTAKRFSYLAASTVVKRIELETEEQARGGDDDAPIIQLAQLFRQTVNAAEEYRQMGYLTGPENQDRWPSDEMAVLSASEWLHRNIQVIKPARCGVQMEAEGSAIAPCPQCRSTTMVAANQDDVLGKGPRHQLRCLQPPGDRGRTHREGTAVARLDRPGGLGQQAVGLRFGRGRFRHHGRG